MAEAVAQRRYAQVNEWGEEPVGDECRGKLNCQFSLSLSHFGGGLQSLAARPIYIVRLRDFRQEEVFRLTFPVDVQCATSADTHRHSSQCTEAYHQKSDPRLPPNFAAFIELSAAL